MSGSTLPTPAEYLFRRWLLPRNLSGDRYALEHYVIHEWRDPEETARHAFASGEEMLERAILHLLSRPPSGMDEQTRSAQLDAVDGLRTLLALVREEWGAFEKSLEVCKEIKQEISSRGQETQRMNAVLGRRILQRAINHLRDTRRGAQARAEAREAREVMSMLWLRLEALSRALGSTAAGASEIPTDLAGIVPAPPTRRPAGKRPTKSRRSGRL